MKAFVAGATGETGRRIVQELIARNIPVRALVRDEQTARAILPPDAELVVGDVLNPASLTAPWVIVQWYCVLLAQNQVLTLPGFIK